MIYWLSHGKKSVQKKKWEVNKGKLPLLTSHFIFWALISMSLIIKFIRMASSPVGLPKHTYIFFKCMSKHSNISHSIKLCEVRSHLLPGDSLSLELYFIIIINNVLYLNS